MPGTYVYVDGFNLYHRALKRTPHKWLDIVGLVEKVLGEEVAIVRYFTARVVAMSHNPHAPTRQDALIRAYAADPRIKLHFGHFKPRRKKGALLHPPPPPAVGEVKTFEEKGSDVNLASFALFDAYEGNSTKTVLLTNDSDLAEPARILQRRTTVGVIIPKRGLKPNTVPADFYKTIRTADLRACQLPDPVPTAKGDVWKPTGW